MFGYRYTKKKMNKKNQKYVVQLIKEETFFDDVSYLCTLLDQIILLKGYSRCMNMIEVIS